MPGRPRFSSDATAACAAIHTGFAGRASGGFHDEMTSEIEATIGRLLAENSASPAN